MGRGYWLDNGMELTNPNLNFAHGVNYVGIGGNAWNISVAEEEVIEKVEKVKEDILEANIKDADYSNVDYIGSPDEALWNEMKGQLNGSHHYSDSPFNNYCLGCLCGGGSHGNPNYSYNSTMNITVGGTIYLKTRASGEQSCQIPEGGGEVIL